MTGFEQFVSLFGNITILDVITFILAVTFLIVVFGKIIKYIIDKHDREKIKDEKFNEVCEAVTKYPEYRKRSAEIREEIYGEIHELQKTNKELTEKMLKIEEKMLSIEEKNNAKELNKLRDILIRNYHYHTNPVNNPNGTWTRMESDAFWAIFKDYEEGGGDGHMHTVVAPAMRALIVIEN